MELPNVFNWMKDFAVQYGYLGVFLISMLGAMSIFIPIPYTVVIFTLGAQPSFDPLWIAVAAGTGSTIGEFSGYLIGFGGRRVIGEKYKKKMDFLTKLFKKFGPIVIFVFSLTPLPDDLLFIPLGIMRYSLLQAFIPALLGKFVSNLIIAYSGRFSVDIIKYIFGVEGEGVSALIGIILALVLMVIVFVIMFKVDWENRFAKLVDEPKKDTDKMSEGNTSE